MLMSIVPLYAALLQLFAIVEMSEELLMNRSHVLN